MNMILYHFGGLLMDKKCYNVTEDVKGHPVEGAIKKAYAEHDHEAKKHGMHPKGNKNVEALPTMGPKERHTHDTGSEY